MVKKSKRKYTKKKIKKSLSGRRTKKRVRKTYKRKTYKRKTYKRKNKKIGGSWDDLPTLKGRALALMKSIEDLQENFRIPQGAEEIKTARADYNKYKKKRAEYEELLEKIKEIESMKGSSPDPEMEEEYFDDSSSDDVSSGYGSSDNGYPDDGYPDDGYPDDGYPDDGSLDDGYPDDTGESLKRDHTEAEKKLVRLQGEFYRFRKGHLQMGTIPEKDEVQVMQQNIAVAREERDQLGNQLDQFLADSLTHREVHADEEYTKPRGQLKLRPNILDNGRMESTFPESPESTAESWSSREKHIGQKRFIPEYAMSPETLKRLSSPIERNTEQGTKGHQEARHQEPEPSPAPSPAPEISLELKKKQRYLINRLSGSTELGVTVPPHNARKGKDPPWICNGLQQPSEILDTLAPNIVPAEKLTDLKETLEIETLMDLINITDKQVEGVIGKPETWTEKQRVDMRKYHRGKSIGDVLRTEASRNICGRIKSATAKNCNCGGTRPKPWPPKGDEAIEEAFDEAEAWQNKKKAERDAERDAKMNKEKSTAAAAKEQRLKKLQGEAEQSAKEKKAAQEEEEMGAVQEMMEPEPAPAMPPAQQPAPAMPPAQQPAPAMPPAQQPAQQSRSTAQKSNKGTLKKPETPTPLTQDDFFGKLEEDLFSRKALKKKIQRNRAKANSAEQSSTTD